MSSDNISVVKLRQCVGHTGGINAVRFTKDGNYAMTCSDDKSIRLFNPHRDSPNGVKEALLIKTYSGIHSYPIYDLAISPDNAKFVAGGADRNIFYYDVATGNVIRRIAGHQMKINAIALNADASVMLSASDDKTLRAWDLRSSMREPIQTFDQFKDSVTCIALTSSSVCAGSVDGYVRTFDLRAGHFHADNMYDPITSVNYAPNQKSIVAMCLGGYIRLLDEESGLIIQEYSSAHVQKSFKSEAIFSNDSDRILCGSEDGSVAVYNFLTGKSDAKIRVDNASSNNLLTSKYSRREAVVTSLSFHPKLPLFLAASNEGIFHCYEIPMKL